MGEVRLTPQHPSRSTFSRLVSMTRPRGSTEAVRRGVITLFIVFHLVVIVVWNMPWSYTQSKIAPPIRPYMLFLGLVQHWGMFSPEPPKENYYMVAQVTYADGSEQWLEIGRQDDLSVGQRLLNDRHRELLEDIYDTQQAQPYYPQVAKWAARRLAARAKAPAVKVELRRYWSPHPTLPDGLKQFPFTTWHHDIVFTMTLEPGSAS